MAYFDTVADISAAAQFSELRLGNAGLTDAFNRSGLGGALESLFAGPHAKLYQVAGSGIWYVPSDGKVSAPKAGQHFADVVFFENPRNGNAAYFIERTVAGMENGRLDSVYTVNIQDRAKHGSSDMADTLMTISGEWSSNAARGRLLEKVQFFEADGTRGHNWQNLVILDLLLKSRPLAQNPLWSAPKL